MNMIYILYDYYMNIIYIVCIPQLTVAAGTGRRW